MENTDGPVTVLSTDESWERLAATKVGRLVTNVGGVLDVAPVNYAVDNHTIVFRTAPGEKLSKLVINSSVLFEADHFGADSAWSVIVRGEAHAIERDDDVFEAEQLELHPFVPTLKTVFVRIAPQEVSGRAFAFGPEPKREDVQEG